MDGIRVGDHLIPESALEEIFETSGGPGGQHANRNETSVRLRLTVSESGLPSHLASTIVTKLGPVVEVTSSESRSQFRNRSMARRRMKEQLEQALKPERTRKPTRPTRSSQRRRVESKKARSETKRLRRRPNIDD